jgi:hypothetical protein
VELRIPTRDQRTNDEHRERERGGESVNGPMPVQVGSQMTWGVVDMTKVDGNVTVAKEPMRLGYVD